jgi:hypothetical protein
MTTSDSSNTPIILPGLVPISDIQLIPGIDSSTPALEGSFPPAPPAPPAPAPAGPTSDVPEGYRRLSVLRALGELKLLTSKIDASIMDIRLKNVPLTAVTIGGEIKQGRTTEKGKFSSNAAALLSSIDSLMDNRSNIKGALVASNAVTKVTIGNISYTVAEAIEFRKVKGVHLNSLLSALQEELARSSTERDRKSTEVEKKNDDILKAAYGESDSKKAKEATKAAEIESLRSTLESTSKVALYDPSNISGKIAELRDRIATFEAEADSAISESNALTSILVKV